MPTPQYQTVTLANADGTVSILQVDPANPIITLPDGTQAQIQGLETAAAAAQQQSQQQVRK